MLMTLSVKEPRKKKRSHRIDLHQHVLGRSFSFHIIDQWCIFSRPSSSSSSLCAGRSVLLFLFYFFSHRDRRCSESTSGLSKEATNDSIGKSGGAPALFNTQQRCWLLSSLLDLFSTRSNTTGLSKPQHSKWNSRPVGLLTIFFF